VLYAGIKLFVSPTNVQSRFRLRDQIPTRGWLSNLILHRLYMLSTLMFAGRRETWPAAGDYARSRRWRNVLGQCGQFSYLYILRIRPLLALPCYCIVVMSSQYCLSVCVSVVHRYYVDRV